MRRASFAVAAVLAASVLYAAPARAYVREKSADGKYDIIWPNPSVKMTVQTGGPTVVPVDDFVAAATAAAASWSDPALDSSFAYTVIRSDAAPTGAAYDHVNTISFRTSGWDEPMYSEGELALTTVWTQGGAIVDSDTEINAAEEGIMWAVLPDDAVADATSPDVDVQNALTHELGHALGLDHPCYLVSPPDPPEVDNLGNPVPSCSDPNLPESVREATMYPSSTRGNIEERTLSADEVQALHDLYPAGRAPVVEGGDPTAGAGGCAVAGGGAGGSSGAALLAAATLLARRRGRRLGLDARRG